MYNQVAPNFFGLFDVEALYSVTGFVYFGVLAVIALLVSLSDLPNRNSVDRSIFWVFGITLVIFSVLRPVGIARDDLSYLEIVKALCETSDCYRGTMPERDRLWFFLVKFGLQYITYDFRVLLLLSGFGLLAKLFVIDRLCTERLLALVLLIPLCYLQFDFTQLRAGFAISWMLVGIFCLIRSRPVLGSVVFFTNFMVHTQAVFSPMLLAYRVFGLRVWILPFSLVVFLILLLVGAYPSVLTLSWLIDIKEASVYYSNMGSVDSSGAKLFPLGYIPILFYGMWFCSTPMASHKKISDIVGAGLFLGMALAWFFAIIPIMQARFFEFYVVPLVLLAGNVGNSRLKTASTIVLALVLYARLELLNDWILG